MSENFPRPSPDELLEQQAASWILRQDRGLTAAEQDEFLQWLTADRRHGPALARHKRNWSRLNVLGQWRPEHSPRPNRDLLAPPPREILRLSALGLSNGIPVRRKWRLSLALAAALVVSAFYLWSRPDGPGAAPVPAAIAAITQRTLEDGSVVELNRGAEISVLYTPGERLVRLEHGEAHFTVAKNKARPFVVSAGGIAVRAVGTAFNVRLAATTVDVLVTEGVVGVTKPVGPPLAGAPSGLSTSDSPTMLSVGERTSIRLDDPAHAPRVMAVTPAQADDILAWQPRMLDFTATPLLGIVNEFNRHNAPLRLVVADPALAGVEMSASLRSDNVEGFIRLLEGGFGVEADRAGDTITLRKAP